MAWPAEIGWVDAVVGGIVALSFFLGVVRGLFASLFGLMAIFGAFWVARAYGGAVFPYARAAMDGSPLAAFVAYAAVFAAAFLALGLAARGLQAAFKAVDMGGFDRFGGALFGLLRGGLLALVFVLLGSAVALHRTAGWRESRAVPALGKVLNFALAPDAAVRRWLRFDERSRPRVVGSAQGLAAVEAAAEVVTAPAPAPAEVVAGGGGGAGERLSEEAAGVVGERGALLNDLTGELRDITNVRTEYHEDLVRQAEMREEAARREAEARARGGGGEAAGQ